MNNPSYLTVNWQSKKGEKKSDLVMNPICGVDFTTYPEKVLIDVQKIKSQLRGEKKITDDVEIVSIEFSK